MGLRQTGLEFVTKGYASFMSQVQGANKGVEKLEAALDKVTKRDFSLKGKTLSDLVPTGVQDKLKGLSKGVGDLVGRMNFLPPSISGAVSSLSGLTGTLGGAVGKMSLATGAAIALTAAFVSLGMRGAAMPGVIQAFDVASAKAGIFSQELLGDLRTASRGTIADFQLMKTANLALAGAGDQLGAALGQNGGLAGLMEIARAQSRATGQGVDYLFESLVSGVKRSTPMLIDNTGLVLKVGEANATYAQSIGKTVEQLSAEEKQIALLNATLAAGKAAVDTYGQGTLQASERLARIQTTITNTLDKLAVAVQPAFNLVLAIGESFVNAVAVPLQTIVIPLVYELSNALLGPLTAAWEGSMAVINSVFQPVATVIHRWMVVLIGVIRGFGAAWSWSLRTLGKVLGPVAGFLKKYLVEPVAKALDPTEFSRRAGYAFGALAKGILNAANTLIFPAVILIAQTIADFLLGFSPPKKGPLSRIDEGGYNVMAAWLDGFMGVSLDPVDQVAAQVNQSLGGIGRLSYDQVQARLQALDTALQPFVDRLDIAKARMQALVDPLQGAQDATEKKLSRELEKFLAGDSSEAAVRALDRQNQVLGERIQQYQDMTDEAEYQLTLKQAEQSAERALLAIQAQRTKQTDQTVAAVKAAATATGTAASAAGSSGGGSGGASDAASAAGGGGSGLDFSSDAVGDWLGVTQDEVDQMWGELGSAFSDGFSSIAGDDLATAKGNLGKLNEQLGRIGSSKPFGTLTSAFDTVFGSGPDSLWGKTKAFGDSISTFFTDTLPGYVSGFSLANFETAWTGAWEYPGGTIWTTLSGFEDGVNTFFTETLPGLFDGFSLEGIKSKFFSTFNPLTGSLPLSMSGFKLRADTFFGPGRSLESLFGGFSLSNLSDTFSGFFADPLGGAQGMLTSFMDKAKEIFDEDGTLYGVLSKVGSFFATLIGAPLEGIANAILDGLFALINGMIVLINHAIEAYNAIPLAPDMDRIELITEIPHISVIPKARTGGAFGPGAALVHRDEMLVGASSKFGVFPAKWVRTMDRIASALTAPVQTVPSRSTGTVTNTTTSSTTITANFNTRDNRQNLRMKLSEVRGLA